MSDRYWAADYDPDPVQSRREAYARSIGWTSWAEREEAIRRNAQRYEAGLRWQQENAAELAQMRGKR